MMQAVAGLAPLFRLNLATKPGSQRQSAESVARRRQQLPPRHSLWSQPHTAPRIPIIHPFKQHTQTKDPRPLFCGGPLYLQTWLSINRGEKLVKVNVKLFAMVREVVGFDEISVTVPDAGPTVADVRRVLLEEHQALEPILPFSQVAVNQEVVADDHGVNTTDEIAILPPFSGG